MIFADNDLWAELCLSALLGATPPVLGGMALPVAQTDGLVRAQAGVVVSCPLAPEAKPVFGPVPVPAVSRSARIFAPAASEAATAQQAEPVRKSWAPSRQLPITLLMFIALLVPALTVAARGVAGRQAAGR